MDEAQKTQNAPAQFLNSLQPHKHGIDMSSPALMIGAAIIILAGAATGFLLSNGSKGKTSAVSSGGLAGLGGALSGISKGQTFGSEDTKTFRDIAEGKIEKGGIEGEGSHKLLRPGGDSQTVALTSSIINLDDFVSRKVKIWGETQTAKKAGWLMDVGRLEVLE